MLMRRHPHGELWRNHDFLKLWLGESVSIVGSQFSLLALPLLAISGLHASAAQVGILNGAQTVPVLLVSLSVGAWLDRHSRRAVVIGTNFGRALLMGLIPLLAFTGTLKIFHVYAIAFAAGCLTAAFDVAYLTYLPSIVEHRQLIDANSKMGLSYSTAQTSGPGLAGLIVQVATAPVAVLVDAVSYLVAGFSVVSIRRPENVAAEARTGHRHLSDIANGLRTIFRHPLLRPLMLMGAWFNFFEQAILTVFLLYAVRSLHLTSGEVGAVITVGGVGAIAGSVLARRAEGLIGVGGCLFAGNAIACGSFVLIPVAAGPRPLLMVLLGFSFVLYGFGLAIYNVHSITARQSLVEAGLLGRINASYKTVTFGTIPLGALCAGWAAEAIGNRIAVTAAVAGLVVGAIRFWFTAVPRVRSWRDTVPIREAASTPVKARTP